MKKRILFVDDDIDLLQLYKKTFRLKYRDVIADFEYSPADAIKKLDKKKYNIIVTDYKMPAINGGMLLNIVKEKRPDIIRIILTAYIDEALKSDYNDPFCYFLKKPIVMGELMDTIEIAMKIK